MNLSDLFQQVDAHKLTLLVNDRGRLEVGPPARCPRRLLYALAAFQPELVCILKFESQHRHLQHTAIQILGGEFDPASRRTKRRLAKSLEILAYRPRVMAALRRLAE